MLGICRGTGQTKSFLKDNHIWSSLLKIYFISYIVCLIYWFIWWPLDRQSYIIHMYYVVSRLCQNKRLIQADVSTIGLLSLPMVPLVWAGVNTVVWLKSLSMVHIYMSMANLLLTYSVLFYIEIKTCINLHYSTYSPTYHIKIKTCLVESESTQIVEQYTMSLIFEGSLRLCSAIADW